MWGWANTETWCMSPKKSPDRDGRRGALGESSGSVKKEGRPARVSWSFWAGRRYQAARLAAQLVFQRQDASLNRVEWTVATDGTKKAQHGYIFSRNIKLSLWKAHTALLSFSRRHRWLLMQEGWLTACHNGFSRCGVSTRSVAGLWVGNGWPEQTHRWNRKSTNCNSKPCISVWRWGVPENHSSRPDTLF